MANYKLLTPIILKWEGGYAGNIDGMICTMKGVTLATFRKYFGKNKTCQDLRNITSSQWDSVFIQGYWNRWSADKIKSQSIANLLVDWVWASGVYGIKYPQQVLGVTADGVVGPKTIAAINNYPNQKELFQKLWNRRKKHFEAVATGSKKKFLNGWMNRLNDFKWID
jgi:lysozyme family protein